MSTNFRPRSATTGWSSSIMTSNSPSRQRRPSATTSRATQNQTPTTTVTNDGLHRVRSYSVTAKGVTRYNVESTIASRCKQQQVNASGNHYGSWSTFSSGSSTYPGSNCSSPRHRSWSNGSSSSSFSDGNYSVVTSQHNVVVIGSADVGKTSLINQFIASDIKEREDQDVELTEKTISILLDGEEAQLTFLNIRSTSERMSEDLAQYDNVTDAYVIVYSVADRRSYNAALRSLTTLREADLLRERAVILVGNKIDLERCRCVSTAEGREMATSYGCKFIETSDWMDHNVDELLVGIVNQIRLKQYVRQRLGSSGHSAMSISLHRRSPSWRTRSQPMAGVALPPPQPQLPPPPPPPPPPSSTSSAKNSPVRQRRSRSVVRNFLKRIHFTSRSCDNLHVL